MVAPPPAIVGGVLDAPHGVEIAAVGLTRTVKGGRAVLSDVSLTVRPGELVAIVGGSGAGKTTLLEALAGVRPAERGDVRFDGVDLYANRDVFRTRLGYVPQDDIIHPELPLEQTLRYAAALRLPAANAKEELDTAVAGVLVYSGAWSAGAAVAILAVISAAGACAQLWTVRDESAA